MFRCALARSLAWLALAALLAGCSVPPTAGMAFPPLLATGQGGASPSGQRQSPAPAQAACPVTPPNQGVPPNAHTAAFSSIWYGSADGKLWASGQAHGEWRAGENKVLWWRPGYTLTVDGRRLDAPAPPLYADIPDGYDADSYQASGLTFPTAGCWEVEAVAGDSSLRFVIQVAPALHPAAGGSCATLADAVQASDVIMEGRVAATHRYPGGYAWQEVVVYRQWRPHSPDAPLGDRIDLLQDTRREPLLEDGHYYLLFLQYEPWQVLCPQRTLAEIVYNASTPTRIIPLGQSPLWSGSTPQEVEGQVRAVR